MSYPIREQDVTGQEDAMSLSGFLPAVSRRAIVVGSVAALVGAASGLELKAQGTAQQQQQTTPQTPQAPAPAQNDPLTFTTPAPRIIMLTLTPDGEQAFEAALQKAKDVIAKPEAKPELKQQAAHWKVSTGANEKQPSTDGFVTLVMVLDQTVPNVTYNPFGILSGSGMTNEQYNSDVKPLNDRVNAGIKGFLDLVITPKLDMAPAAGGGH